jgi:predicted RNA binding protein with dsRBD fold (UPF0201 family)
MKRLILCILCCVLLVSCATAEIQKTQLQIREYQTRIYDTNDQDLVMKAMINVLQDSGFIVYNANEKLGLILAKKEFNTEGVTGLLWPNTIIECSINVTLLGNRIDTVNYFL